MRLYFAPTSPYVRKVMVVLHETGQLDDTEIVSVYGTPMDPQSMPIAKNPLGKLPALERIDGPTLYDSRVITRYLDARADAGLYPAPPRLWETLTLEATADGILDAALLMVYEKRLRPDELQMPDYVEGQWSKVARATAALEALWMSHLQGRFDIGHIAVGCALGYLDFRLPDRDWRSANPALSNWYAAFSERPSMSATVPVNP